MSDARLVWSDYKMMTSDLSASNVECRRVKSRALVNK